MSCLTLKARCHLLVHRCSTAETVEGGIITPLRIQLEILFLRRNMARKLTHQNSLGNGWYLEEESNCITSRLIAETTTTRTATYNLEKLILYVITRHSPTPYSGFHDAHLKPSTCVSARLISLLNGLLSFIFASSLASYKVPGRYPGSSF